MTSNTNAATGGSQVVGGWPPTAESEELTLGREPQQQVDEFLVRPATPNW